MSQALESEPTAPSARALLRLPTGPSRSWMDFDAPWYLRTYPRARLALGEATDDAAMAYYLDHGQRQGDSPNPLFDEAYFLRMHPGAANAMRAGAAESGFDAYCRGQGRYRRPHWLFDEGWYRKQYSDLTDETLAAHGMLNGYDHFLHHGSREGRSGSPFFDPVFYHAGLSPEEAAAAEATGWFADFLDRLHAHGGPERAGSIYFDPVWYLRSYEAVARAVAAGEFVSALHHYLTNDTPTRFDPRPEFSEQFYLERYPDIAAAIEAGDILNGYHHFLFDGVFEGRAPSAFIDLDRYVETSPTAREDLQNGIARDAFAHYLSSGGTQLPPALESAEELVTEAQARALFRQRAETLVPVHARRPLDFSYAGAPALSVIMVVHDDFALTLQALASLRGNFPGPIDLILVDAGSTDETETVPIERCVQGATVLRFDMNIGALRGANAGLQVVAADTVLFLHNDLELAHGAVRAALDRLASDARIGAVGGKLVRAHGRLKEAGCIVWQDGATAAYMRDAPAAAPPANFVRDVDFCSSVFLMARGDVLRALDGFADELASDHYGDADLCLRIRQAGFRVVYEPAAVVHCLEHGARQAEAALRRARQVFVRRRADALRERRIADPKAVAFARSTDTPRHRVLFVADTVPLRMPGSGLARANDLVSVMAEIGCLVTVFPLLPHSFDLAAIYADIPDTVEVMFESTLADLPAFLDSRPGYYDTVWVARARNLDRLRPILDELDPPPRIVLDTEATIAPREPEAGAPAAQGQDADLDAAIAARLASASVCRGIVAVSELEAARLRALGLRDVSVIRPVRVPTPTVRRFADRAGLLFAGTIRDIASPDYASLCWLADEVLPLVKDLLGSEVRLTMAGFMAEGVTLERFRDHPRVSLRGPVPDMTLLYDAHRVFVAPARVAAGTRFEVQEAAAHGLPVVASELLCRQTGWEDGKELLAAPTDNAKLFAQQIVALYVDRARWQRVRDAALARLAAENGRERCVAALRGLLG